MIPCQAISTMTAIIARTCRRQALRFLFIIVASRSVQGSSQLADMTGQHWIIAAKGVSTPFEYEKLRI